MECPFSFVNSLEMYFYKSYIDGSPSVLRTANQMHDCQGLPIKLIEDSLMQTNEIASLYEFLACKEIS